MFETSLPILSFFEQMNSHGKAGIPFVFLIDFEMRKPFLIPFYEKKIIFFSQLKDFQTVCKITFIAENK